MKKILRSVIVVVALMSATMAIAQEGRSTLRWQGHETNRFWDNWEISVGGGASSLKVANRSGAKDPGKFFDRVGWNANVGFTKWVVPIIGMRLQLDAGEFQNYSMDKPRFGNGAFKTPYMFVHGDILVNMSNWIGGYRENRIYSAISYIGFGYTAMSWTKKSAGSYNGEYAFSSGLLNKFRVCRQLDIELDLRSWLFAEKGLPQEIQSGGRYAFAMSASLGVAYRFNQRDWTPAYSAVEVDGYLAAIVLLEQQLLSTGEHLAKANKQVDNLTADNARLKSDLETCRAKKPKTEYVAMGEGVVFFNIGEAQLSDYASATLDGYIATLSKSNAPIHITGYADKETGSAERNEQLSMERAENVKAYLLDAGIAPSRITTTWVGDTVKAFDSPDTPVVNRCVIIK